MSGEEERKACRMAVCKLDAVYVVRMCICSKGLALFSMFNWQGAFLTPVTQLSLHNLLDWETPELTDNPHTVATSAFHQLPNEHLPNTTHYPLLGAPAESNTRSQPFPSLPKLGVASTSVEKERRRILLHHGYISDRDRGMGADERQRLDSRQS